MTGSEQFSIGHRLIGGDAPCLLIAEIGQAHDGSLGTAHAYIDAVADVGADAIKFQTHIAAAESTLDEPFRVRFTTQDATRYEYWQRMEFRASQWRELAVHATDRGLLFLSSAFSVDAVELLDDVGMPAWKVGSGEFASSELLRAMASTGRPVLLSTGMSTYAEIARGVDLIREGGAPVALFQATSRYPVELSAIGLSVMDEMRTRFDCPVGLSVHHPSIWPAVAAMVLGAAMVEVHVVFDRRMFGPDTGSSLELDELAMLVDGRTAIHTMQQAAIDKDAVAVELEPMRALFAKSLALRTDLPAGTLLTPELLTGKKPGTGIPLAAQEEIVGRRLRNDVLAERLLRREDLHE